MSFESNQAAGDTNGTTAVKQEQEVENAKATITVDDVKQFLETKEGLEILRPKLDKHFDKGLATWKENHLSKLEKELAATLEEKYNPPKNEWEVKYKELERRLDEKELNEKKLKLKDEARKRLSHSEFEEVLDFIVTADADSTFGNVDLINSVVEAVLKKAKLGKLRDNSQNPKSGNRESLSYNPFDPKNPNYTAQGQIMAKDPAEAERLMKLAGVK